MSPAPNSIFDIIGPVMVGPSSSHTAGAVRLGLVARALLGDTPQIAKIELHGSFARTGPGHGTDKALIAGLLGMDTADERIRDSFVLAKEAGLVFEFLEADLGEEAHPNSVRFTLTAGDKTLEMSGASVGGGMIQITRLQGRSVQIRAELDTLILIADDRPGTINAVSGWLAAHQINIAFLRLKRDQRGGKAMMVIETDQNIPEALTRDLASLPWVHWVYQIPRLKE
ncbi:MAG TPA: L-serine ammonia-lyase, iron-sulfur-dependent subunit beta [Anaerolineaceae bacterium]|nr:L-serine ammonia-lyase, iron-sulfur-dependent subunit beta [Anaerolineaceae bacterium]HNS36360.1 L-serine ammonia-lyase, iron-sulfur-dependent subunit beta [Anaerolineaceae bacterium]HQF61081.1 L-serine ammonia-lyase, iron-sulfur-dependent subunit beta [Anaerolineaceae bacterium]HQH85385.1 L-serine ammonia-lyase, iron-sulfur-dependent subunit beta [Anaerolineaceae bacterium]